MGEAGGGEIGFFRAKSGFSGSLTRLVTDSPKW
jgi:hypothetical protein